MTVPVFPLLKLVKFSMLLKFLLNSFFSESLLYRLHFLFDNAIRPVKSESVFSLYEVFPKLLFYNGKIKIPWWKTLQDLQRSLKIFIRIFVDPDEDLVRSSSISSKIL